MASAAAGNQRGAGDDEAARKIRIRAAFDMFDKDKKGCVIQEEVSTIMRYLGAYPSEKDIIKKILPEMQEDEPSTFVTYDRFEKKMLEVLYTNEYEPDTDETLLAAFRVIDVEQKGFIEADVMRELLITKGTPFREKEMEAFLGAAKDPQTGRIYYEDYIAVLMQALDPKRAWPTHPATLISVEPERAKANSMRPAATPSSFSRRPSTLVNLHDLHQLIHECDASLQTQPTCLHTLAVRGHACMKAKLWDLAIRDFSHILHCRPDDIHGRFSRGMAFFKTGHIESAHLDFSRVLELNPHHVMARYARAGCYNTEGEFHEAILDYTIALEHDEKEQEGAFRIEKLHRLGAMTASANTDTRDLHHQLERRHHDHQPEATARVGVSAVQGPTDQQQTSIPSQPLLQLQVRDPILRGANGDHRVPSTKSDTPMFIEAPILQPQQVQSSSPSHAGQIPSRAPRRVIQVRVNLSEFAAVSGPPNTDRTPPSESQHSKSAVLSDQQPVAQIQAPQTQIPAAGRGCEPASQPRPETNPNPAAQSTSSSGASSGASQPAPPEQVMHPQPRVIRKVTVTL